MEVRDTIKTLNQNHSVFKSLLENKREEEYLWQPTPNKWSLKDIVCHLLDEELLDFRFRTKHALNTPSETLPPIDPEGWVVTHNYASKEYSKTLTEFLVARSESVTWLKTQITGKWDNICNHPQLGPISAKQFLNNWLAHDYLHIRQINRYHYHYFQANADTNLDYAGNW